MKNKCSPTKIPYCFLSNPLQWRTGFTLHCVRLVAVVKLESLENGVSLPAPHSLFKSCFAPLGPSKPHPVATNLGPAVLCRQEEWRVAAVRLQL